MTQTVSLSFFRFSGPLARAWALTMMGGARLPLARTADIGFWKLCGSGSGEGFTPVPNTAVYAILATWPDAETARARTQSGIFATYQKRATEDWTVFLQTQTSRGAWSGQDDPQGQVRPRSPAPFPCARGSWPDRRQLRQADLPDRQLLAFCFSSERQDLSSGHGAGAIPRSTPACHHPAAPGVSGPTA